MQDILKRLMREQGETYASLAHKIGWTTQNLWDKLNNRNRPTATPLIKIMHALGYELNFSHSDGKDATKDIDLTELYDDLEEYDVSYDAFTAILGAMGIVTRIERIA